MAQRKLLKGWQMTAPTEPNQEIDELLIILARLQEGVYTLTEARQAIQRLISEAVLAELDDLSFKVVEPCEPDCDEVRHALHEGSWNAHLVIDERLAELKTRLRGSDKDLPGYEAGTIFEKDDELPIRKQAMTSRGKLGDNRDG